jgi:hypothetical protein
MGDLKSEYRAWEYDEERHRGARHLQDRYLAKKILFSLVDDLRGRSPFVTSMAGITDDEFDELLEVWNRLILDGVQKVV